MQDTGSESGMTKRGFMVFLPAILPTAFQPLSPDREGTFNYLYGL